MKELDSVKKADTRSLLYRRVYYEITVTGMIRMLNKKYFRSTDEVCLIEVGVHSIDKKMPHLKGAAFGLH